MPASQHLGRRTEFGSAKLSLRDRAQAVVLAYESSLIKPGETDR
ncbi:hypothetical protein ACIQU5_22725 [Streptomyces sp. NPDC090306]